VYIYTLVKGFMPKFLNFYVKPFSFWEKVNRSMKNTVFQNSPIVSRISFLSTRKSLLIRKTLQNQEGWLNWIDIFGKRLLI
jgi:hypothetical protein